MCTEAPAAAANAALSSPIVPGPQTRTRRPGAAKAAEAARQALPPGSTRAPTVSSIPDGSRCRLDAGTITCSASAPAQPMIPTSCLSAQMCQRPARHREHRPQPSMVSPVTRRPSHSSGTPVPTADTTPHHSCPGRTGNRVFPCPKYAISPVNSSTSVPQIPTRRTSTTTCPAPATGGSTSSTRAAPGPVITSARNDASARPAARRRAQEPRRARPRVPAARRAAGSSAPECPAPGLGARRRSAPGPAAGCRARGAASPG